jgi:hypothetical protein
MTNTGESVTVESKQHGGTGHFWFEVWRQYATPGLGRFVQTDGAWKTPTEAITAGRQWAKRNGYHIVRGL